ncbi:MAG: hypothetical protein GXO62_02160 [Epsilonproteobacteria bacterium]|nr:hypothetical protein [Campylobacterota bacterium]
MGNIVEVDGLIKTINDASAVIDALKSVDDDNVVLRVRESFGLPSSIIGYLVKLKDEGKNVTVEVGSDILYDLLDNLNLISSFNVRRV